MSNILSIHNKLLDYLLKKRESNPELYFLPRKNNNKGRKDKGYWFLGNENYLQVAFWSGRDWKEKVYNIGFFVASDKNSWVEFSAQDSNDKAIFFDLIARKIGGFYKHKTKNKWYKEYQGKNYISHLNDFLNTDKPKIDKYITNYKPADIYPISENEFILYTKKIIDNRIQQKSKGQVDKIVRLCWNNEKWRFPSGIDGKSKDLNSYERTFGFGHEEWLFDRSKVSDDGFHYAFVQPLNLKSDKHYNKTFNLHLYTIDPDNDKLLVGIIRNVFCISKQDSEAEFLKYQQRGWMDDMKKQVEIKEGIWNSEIALSPEIFFNIKFKFDDVEEFEEYIYIGSDDINISTNRFKLLPKETEFNFDYEEPLIIPDNQDDFVGNKKNTNTRTKTYNVECTFDPYHDIMQNAINDYLNQSKEYKQVYIERNRVDIKAITHDGIWHYFEIKTDNAKLSVRKALGQIMEYSYFPNVENAQKMIVVSYDRPNLEVIAYLNMIRTRFNIPVWYRYFDLQKNYLSQDY